MKQNKKKLTEKQLKKRRKHTIIAIVEGTVILAGIVFLFLYNIGVAGNKTTAIEIAGESYQLSEFNYYYYAYYNAYLAENTDYLSYMFDNSKSLKEQEYAEGTTWFDFFKDQAKDSMKSIITVAKEAEKKGVSLSQADRTKVAQMLAEISDNAKQNNITTNQFLQNIYGAGMNKELYEKHVVYSHLATTYSNQIKADFSFTEQEIEDYYNKNIEKYTYVKYERFFVKACDRKETPSQEQKETALALAKEIHQKVKDGSSLEELGKEYQDFGTYYSFEDAYYDKSFSYGEWLFAPERKAGDSNIIDDGTGYYVMVFHDRERSTYQTVNLLDVFIEADIKALDTTAADYTEQKNQLYEDSCTKAEAIYKAWEKNGKGRKEFEKIGMEKETGVQYMVHQQLLKKTLDSEIDEWCFDKARKEGDCTVLYTESGFHVVYFDDAKAAAWQVKAEADLRDNEYQSWYQNITKSVKVKEHDQVLDQAGDNL